MVLLSGAVEGGWRIAHHEPVKSRRILNYWLGEDPEVVTFPLLLVVVRRSEDVQEGCRPPYTLYLVDV